MTIGGFATARDGGGGGAEGARDGALEFFFPSPSKISRSDPLLSLEGMSAAMVDS
jgi:hypothetical protein